MDLHIPNMTCGGCLRSVTRAVQSVAPSAKVDANLAERRIRITGATDGTAVRAALAAAGFAAQDPVATPGR